MWSASPPPSSGNRIDASPSAIVAADLDGDGNVDLAVTNTFTASVSVLLGDGDGGFAAPGQSKKCVLGRSCGSPSSTTSTCSL